MKDPAGGKVFMGPQYQCGSAGAPFAAICNYQLQWFDLGGKLTEPTGFVDITATIVAGIDTAGRGAAEAPHHRDRVEMTAHDDVVDRVHAMSEGTVRFEIRGPPRG